MINEQQHQARNSDDAEAYKNLGNALANQGKYDDAATQYEKAIMLKPDYAEAYNNLANVLKQTGKLDAAVAKYELAIALKPDYAAAYSNLGSALRDQDKLDDAIMRYEQAIALKPDYAEVYSNLGSALRDQGKFDDAIARYEQAIALKPDSARIHVSLGIVLMDQNKLDPAIVHFRRCLELDPGFVKAHTAIVFFSHHHPDYDSTALNQEARRWNDQHAAPLGKYRQPHTNSADPERRLRIGYVSPDFRNHAVSHFILPLLSNHDPRQVEIFCYAEVARPDDTTERLQACADGWRVTVGLTDEQMADMVRKDRIDILVDLALHTTNNRLLVFARKPAPVQVTWLGYPGTTGMPTIDYRLTDPYLDPPGIGDSDYTEESIRLPDASWCYAPNIDIPMVKTLPAFKNGFVTLGCLNAFCKVNDRMLVLWAKILRALPNSHLLLFVPPGSTRNHVLAKFQEEGVAATRLHFTYRQSKKVHMQLYNGIDLCLDTLPYGGGTTSLEALWMGVPVITLVGKTVTGRVGWSILCNLGLQELAAQTPEEYIAITVQLAGDLHRLQALRTGLRERMHASPLMDGKRFAFNMEQAYRQMWRRWCKEAVHDIVAMQNS